MLTCTDNHYRIRKKVQFVGIQSKAIKPINATNIFNSSETVIRGQMPIATSARTIALSGNGINKISDKANKLIEINQAQVTCIAVSTSMKLFGLFINKSLSLHFIKLCLNQ